MSIVNRHRPLAEHIEKKELDDVRREAAEKVARILGQYPEANALGNALMMCKYHIYDDKKLIAQVKAFTPQSRYAFALK